jgi:hypothetical protein
MASRADEKLAVSFQEQRVGAILSRDTMEFIYHLSSRARTPLGVMKIKRSDYDRKRGAALKGEGIFERIFLFRKQQLQIHLSARPLMPTTRATKESKRERPSRHPPHPQWIPFYLRMVMGWSE